MTQEKITLRNTKKEIFEAYQKLNKGTEIQQVEAMMEKFNSTKGPRNHAIYLNARNLLRTLKKYL